MGQKTEMCAYCADEKLASRDHIFPLCLLNTPYPDNLPTVPSCTSCNNVRKSRQDIFLRDLLVNDFQAQMPAEVKEVQQGKFERAKAKNRSELARLMEEEGTPLPLFDFEGRILMVARSAYDGEKRIQKTFTLLSQGVFFFLHKVPLQPTFQYQVFRFHPQQFKEVLEGLSLTEWKRVGSTISYMVVVAQNNPLICACVFQLFGSVNVIVYITEDPKLTMMGKMRRFGHHPDQEFEIE